MKPITKNAQKLPDAIGAQARQGDVLIERLASAPEGETVPRDKRSGCVLALGKATGHHHHVPHKGASMRRVKDADPLADRILSLKEAAKVLHEEHFPIYLPSGDYRVEIQEEYEPEELRPVID